jgi:hypothetical protein
LFNSEIFTGLLEGKIVTAYLTFPIPVGIDLVDQNRSMLAAMPGEIALAVAVDIQPPNQAPALDWFLPHPCQEMSRGSPSFTDNQGAIS